MERIFPITSAAVTPFVGSPICAVLHDGTHYYGMLEKIDGDQMILTGYIRKPGELETYAKKNKPSVSKAKKVKTTAFFPGFGFQRFVLPFVSLALLFALPFLGFPFFI